MLVHTDFVLRTTGLVCLGATLVMLVSIFGFEDVMGREGVTLSS